MRLQILSHPSIPGVTLYFCTGSYADCHETKSKHIDWTPGLECDQWVWPWPWPWPWIFKVKYGISYISTKSDPIATKRKANISIEPQASNVTNVFDLYHNLDIWILKVKRDLDLWPHTWPWTWIFKFWNSCNSEWEGRLTLHKGGGSSSFMTMTMKIWWPRSRCMDLPDSDRSDFSCRRAVDSSSLITEGVTIFNRYPATRCPRRHVQWKLCEFASFVL